MTNKRSIAIVAALLIAGAMRAFAADSVKCRPFDMTQVHLLPSRFQDNMKSIKDFKTKTGVELIPFYDAHHCRYAVYWQK